MSCSISTVAVAPPCLEFASARKQKEALVLFLCQVLAELDVEAGCSDWAARLATAETNGLLCLNAGQLRLLQATVVCEGLEVDCKDLQCFSQQDLEALQVDLMCRIINELNP